MERIILIWIVYHQLINQILVYYVLCHTILFKISATLGPQVPIWGSQPQLSWCRVTRLPPRAHFGQRAMSHVPPPLSPEVGRNHPQNEHTWPVAPWIMACQQLENVRFFFESVTWVEKLWQHYVKLQKSSISMANTSLVYQDKKKLAHRAWRLKPESPCLILQLKNGMVQWFHGENVGKA